MNAPTPARTLLLLGLLAAGSVPGSGAARQGQEPPDPLSRDADAGVVLDREGVAARKAVLADRWGPADARTRIELGDWLKTGTRGANALSFSLAGGGEVLLGPGALVEVTGPDRLRLARGDLRAGATEAAPLVVDGPGGASLRVATRSVLRARDGRLERLAEDPRWLSGYEGHASTEALGTLLANVDGRNVPLTIGYHKVTVDVRDQIARTVVEESFVNHTSGILEGIFYFPLPADASISGFGMWIGDELVQGDVVEKQRAREIYETILRERRDPGLLEWSGGNVFKARVFPIAAEKRIRISYTQVLPKEGDTFAYHYALQSELLRQHPLRRLQIEVNVASGEAIESVHCPSHECRVRAGEHSAKVELDAEEYVPDRDFELRVRTRARDPRAAENGWKVTAVPHRRGGDGYFMLLVDAPPPPSELRDAARPPADPLDVLVIADTSGSTHGPARAAQVSFVEALLGALSERDTFNLATADVETRGAFPRPRPADDGAREEALAFLEAREPLGWTDLDAAFDHAFGAAGPGTHVVYVGDGEPTAGDADPVALAERLRRRWPGAGTFHAVVPGNRSEMAVLRALAALGGGSVRSIGGGSDPAAAAFALLREIAAPAVKDVELAFEGMRVAAVYPERLPNLPYGGQQVVVGRFDPTLGNPRGRATVTGRLASGETVRFAAGVDLAPEDPAEEESGNSFVPRLWARSHLDHLLEQGSSPDVRERVIALSEDFQVLTPYTSFLVLETDEDRERFQVQRRFRMRDGEEFFAEGRASARHELLREQMRAARTWRQRLSEETLTALARMARERTELLRPDWRPRYAGIGGADESLFLGHSGVQFQEGAGAYRGPGDTVAPADWRDEDGLVTFTAEPEEAGPSGPATPPAEPLLEAFEEDARADAPFGLASRAAKRRELFAGERAGSDDFFLGNAEPSSYGQLHYFPYPPYDPFANLFPAVGGPRAPEPELAWPAEVAELLARLDRRPRVAAPGGGFAFRVRRTHTDARGRAQTTEGTLVAGAERWVARAGHLPGHVHDVQWLAESERGHARIGWTLGRVRPAEEGDAGAWPEPFPWYFGDVLRGYAEHDARLEAGEGGRVLVHLSDERYPGRVLVLEIDPGRALLVETRQHVDGELVSRLTFDDFREVGGVWWPGVARTWHADQAASTETRIEVEALDGAGLGERAARDLAFRERAILTGPDVDDVPVAKQAVAGGDAGFEERWALLRHHAATQRWKLAAPHFAAIEAMHAGKPGLALLRATLLQASRRNDELRALLMDLARELAERPREAEYGMATSLMDLSANLERGHEQLAFLEALEPVFARRTGVLDARLPWDQRAQSALDSLGRPDEAFAMLERMAADYPYQWPVQTSFAHALARRGEVDRAVTSLEASVADDGPWQPHGVRQLHEALGQILWGAHRLADFVALVERWERDDPARLESALLNRYLSALVFLDREDESWARVERWLVEYRRADLEPLELARLQAAVQVALGHGHDMRVVRYDDDRAALLADTARALASFGAEHEHLVAQILQDYRFRATDAARAVLAEMHAELVARVVELPAQEIARTFRLLRGAAFETDADEDGWQAILDAVHERWVAAGDEADRAVLVQLLQGYGRHELVVRVQRRLLETAEGEEATVAAARALFGVLMQGTWSPAVEAELVALLPRVAPTTEPVSDAASDAHVIALHDLAGWLPRARAEAEVAALPDVNSMPRRLLAVRRDEALREARRATAALLAGIAPTLPGPLRPWASIERAYLLVKLRSGEDEACADAARILDELEARHREGEGSIPARDRILAERCAATLAFLAVLAEGPAQAEQEAALLARAEAGIESGSLLLDWRSVEYALLVALDRGDAVQAVLAEWYGGGEEYAALRWGRDLAYVLAERGDLEGAVRAMRSIEELDELGHADLRALADWYVVLDRPEEAREARIRSWEVLGESALSELLRRASPRDSRGGDDVPPELDPETPERFVALMRKASHPANHCGLLRDYYAATNDFRLLECLPEAVLGHSALRIYPFLRRIGDVAELVHEEATVDRVRAHLEELRSARAGTDVDRRALSLLELQIVRRATLQTHGTEREAEVALRALRDAFRGEWQRGETALMAGFLADQGALEPAELGHEQLRQLRELLRLSAHDHDRFVVGVHLASTLWQHGRHDEAIRGMEAALDGYREVQAGGLPRDANDALSTLGSWLQSVGSHRRAEELWLRELAADRAPDQHRWLEERLFELYRDAVVARADVSLGGGRGLYPAVVERILASLAVRTDEQHAARVLGTLCNLWRAAHEELKDERAERDAVRFAFSDLPRVLDLYRYRGGQGMVGTMADCLSSVSDERTALRFLVGRAENEPRWLRLKGEELWSQHAWRVGSLLRKAQPLDRELSDRLLAVVTREVLEDLRSRRSRNRSVYDVRYSNFWEERRDAFREVAARFLDERARSGAAVAYATEYLFRGLHAHDLAIEALARAYARGLLDVDGRTQLATFLQERERWAESLPVVTALVEERPADVQHRVMLMRALHHTGAREALVRALAAARDWYRDAGQWSEPPIAALASACLETELHRDSVELYDEAIALHVKSAPNRGVGDGTLGAYYQGLAAAWSGLGDTARAVDAAAGAVVAWGRSIYERGQALARLEEVLASAPDLDAYAEQLDAESEATGLENPILRKALGSVYLGRGAVERAAAQLRRALAIQPHDMETHERLVAAYEGMGRPDLAAEALADQARAVERDLALYRRLGERLARLGREDQAERAYTSAVELQPHESESHVLLAEVRQEQGRWEDAARQWQHVVRVRTGEPTGYLGLARAWIELERWDEARAVVDELVGNEWPERFGDVREEGRALLGEIPRSR